MTFGINTFLFTSPFTTPSTEWFDQFRAWGFDQVEIALEDPAHINPAQVRAELDRSGLRCETICAALSPDRDLRGTPQQQQTALAYLRGVLDVMPTLGATLLIGPLYSAVGRAGPVSATDYQQQWQTATDHLRGLAQYAQDRGLRLAIEPLNRFETDFVNTAEQGLRLVEAVGHPALGLHLDTFHMNIEEKHLPEAIRRAGKHLFHLHACGSDRGTPGNDHTDWPGIVAALRSVEYDGPVVIESFTVDVAVIAKAAAIWRAIEPSRDAIARDGVRFLRRVFDVPNAR